VNWKLAGLLQFIDDRLAAELRQTQRILAILSVAHLALDVGFGRMPAESSIETCKVQLVHVERATLMLALILAANAVGLRSVDVKSLPNLQPGANGAVPERLLCSVIAPAFVKLLDGENPGNRAIEQLRADASTLGIMRLTLLWPSSNRVSKGAVTRHLSLNANVSAAWEQIGIDDPARRSQWWLTTVCSRLVQLGLGSCQKQNDGNGYVKPTREELQTEDIQNTLREHFQLTPEDVIATLAPAESASQGLPRQQRERPAAANERPAQVRRLDPAAVQAEGLAAGLDA
jgi:hypothetical protein